MELTAPAFLWRPLIQPFLLPTLLYSDIRISSFLLDGNFPFLSTTMAGGSAHFHPLTTPLVQGWAHGPQHPIRDGPGIVA